MEPTGLSRVQDGVALSGSRSDAWKFYLALGVLILITIVGFRQSLVQFIAADDRMAQWQANASVSPTSAPVVNNVQPRDFDAILNETLPLFDIDPTNIPPLFRQKIQRNVHDYGVLHRPQTEALLHRGAPYLPTIKRLLQQYNLPTYFAFIPIVESGFFPDAAHPGSGARGLWQLMPKTARAYGLKVSDTVDERRDPLLSTRAAVRYLHELVEIFGQKAPLHVLAAYNYGENNLSKAIVRARTRDIWRLSRRRLIPFQTREYLVRMIAMWIISAHIDRYNLAPIPSISGPVNPFTEVTFSRPVKIEFIAQQIGLPKGQIQAMNPHLLKPRVPAQTPIRIPVSKVNAFVHFEVRLTGPMSPEYCCARLIVVENCLHTVSEGETASAISQRYSIALETLKYLNQLEGTDPIIRPGQQLSVCEARQTKAAVNSKLW